MASTGADRCQCIDASDILASIQGSGSCPSNGQEGVLLPTGACVPFDFGSSACRKWDLLTDPHCVIEANSTRKPDPYCLESWCFVDRDACTERSTERVRRSDAFPSAGLFYSYSTCNSTETAWVESVENNRKNQVLDGITIMAAVPEFDWPFMFKRDESGEALITGDPPEYYFNKSIPYEGIHVNYIRDLIDLSNGDIASINLTHTSKGSKTQHLSKFTAAVQDVSNGLVDMAIGSFWVTGERLKLTTFTIPIETDKTVLVIPKPGSDQQDLRYNAVKVFQPFSVGMWMLLLAIIAVAALLSVWFTDRDNVARARYGRSLRRIEDGATKINKSVYARLYLDALIRKFLFFFSAGVETEPQAHLPHKILLFGFGFCILITVSAYVADLAAFLTQSRITSVTTIQAAIRAGYTICAPLPLKEQLKSNWPDANFFWHKGLGSEMPDEHTAGNCDVLAVGKVDTETNMETMAKYCEKELLFTDSVLLEVPIAFPVSPMLASGLSYWMRQGAMFSDVSVHRSRENYVKKYGIEPTCKYKLSDNEGRGDIEQIRPANLFIPTAVFFSCAFIAGMLEIVRTHLRNGPNEILRSLGRTSSLPLHGEEDERRIIQSAWASEVKDSKGGSAGIASVDNGVLLEETDRSNGREYEVTQHSKVG